MTQRRGDVGEESIDLPFGAVPPAISRHHSHERGDNNRGAHGRRGGHIRGIILVGPTLWLIHDVFGPITQMLQADPVDVLTSVARLVAEAPSLREVVAGLAGTLRAPIPFERLHVLRLDRADSFVLYTARETGDVEVTKHLVGDPATQMDAVDDAARSRIVCTIRQGARVHGALWLTSANEGAFCTAHQKLMDSVVDLLGLAFEHDAIVERDKLRRERIDSLRGLLQTMAGALDIRRVFDKVSEVVRGGLPHDMLVITSWGADGTSFRIYAMAGATAEPDFFEAQPLSGDDLAQLQRDAYVIHDADTEVPPTSLRGKIFRRFGVRSALRVLMPLGTKVFGSLFFLSWQTDRFSEDDVDFARRVADHLALALSHEQLAEAARSQAESRETAARLEAQVATLTRELESRSGHRRVVGQSKQWKDVLAHAARVAHTETTVLLTGESGTGKEVVARFIHHASRRSQGPFVAINCAALPDQLLESELFGHERGAFTGAVSAKPGRIEQANGGVLFLDEVGEMAPTVQAKLLRVLEEREFMRLGSTRVAARRYSSDRGNQPRPPRRHATRRVPRGPLLPARRLRDLIAAAARSSRRRAGAGGFVPCRDRRDRRATGGWHLARGAENIS